MGKHLDNGMAVRRNEGLCGSGVKDRGEFAFSF